MKKKYYTHSGKMHADEVTGYAICILAGQSIESVRLTKIEEIPTDGIVADIGRVHDKNQNRFDHHQEFLKRKHNNYPLASAGLLWQRYGHDAVLNSIPVNSEIKITTENIKIITKKVDEKLIRGIDAHDADNEYHVEARCSAGEVNVYTLPNVISFFNDEDVNDHKTQHENFEAAAGLMLRILKKRILLAYNELIDAEYIESNGVFLNDGKVLVLEKKVNWFNIVHDNYSDEVMYVIEPSQHPGSPFSMTALSKNPNTRELKMCIERSPFFKGFIHEKKWISGGQSIDELLKLAYWNLMF